MALFRLNQRCTYWGFPVFRGTKRQSIDRAMFLISAGITPTFNPNISEEYRTNRWKAELWTANY